MKNYFTILLLTSTICINAQTLTFAGFSQCLNKSLQINVATNSSYNPNLHTLTGSNVRWDASGLTADPNIPTFNLKHYSPSTTPHAALYPESNYCEFDKDMLNFVSYNFMGINNDSLVEWGAYASTGTHEIFQNPDKRLVFPFSLNDSFTDTYAKTNYSNATTVSSTQTGTRIVTFVGYGTLQLPNATYSDVALIIELRTNSLGANSMNYTWMRISDGKRLMTRSGNQGRTTIAFCSELNSGINTISNYKERVMYPNPVEKGGVLRFATENLSQHSTFRLFDTQGRLVWQQNIINNSINLKNDLHAGIYFYIISDDDKQIHGKIEIN